VPPAKGFLEIQMSLASELENFAAKGSSNFGDGPSSGFTTVEHDIVNAARVGETLAKGAWDYTIHNPGYVAKTAAITVGTGVLVGAAMALLPESAVVGAVVGVSGAALGGIGFASMGIQTYDAFKESLPGLHIVWDADHHSPAEVDSAKRLVEANTGGAMANIALLLPCFVVGNVAGNLGANATLASKAAWAAGATTGSEVAATSAAAAEASDAAVTALAADAPGAALTDAPAVAPHPVQFTGRAVGAAAASARVEGHSLWTFLNHNPLDDIPHPTAWMRLNNNNAFGFEANYWVEKGDIEAVSSLPGRFTTAEATTIRHDQSKPTKSA
jgi:hypothetical protein